MPARQSLSATLLVVIVLIAGAWADTEILKSGEKIEGEILSEAGDEMTVAVRVTATIQEERVIRKADIDRIDKVPPDEETWMALAGVEPGPDSLDRDDYKRILGLLGEFLNAYPKSGRAPAARDRMERFKAELERVEGGELKMGGEWLGREKVREERIQLGGHVLHNRMKAHASGGRLIEALNVFDYLEKNFAGSASYPEAVSLARKILSALKPVVEQQQARLKRRVEENRQRVQTAQGAERAQLEALLAREQAAAEAAVAAAEKSGVKWLPLQPSTDRSVAALLSRVSSEMTRLNGLPVEKMTQAIKAAESAVAELEKNDLAAAERMLNEAANAWPANERVVRLKKKLVDARAAEAAIKAAAARATPTPTPKPKPTPTPAPAVVAEAPPTPEYVPFYRRPVFFVVMVLLLVFGSLGVKAYRKVQAPEHNILDQ